MGIVVSGQWPANGKQQTANSKQQTAKTTVPSTIGSLIRSGAPFILYSTAAEH